LTLQALGEEGGDPQEVVTQGPRLTFLKSKTSPTARKGIYLCEAQATGNAEGGGSDNKVSSADPRERLVLWKQRVRRSDLPTMGL